MVIAIALSLIVTALIRITVDRLLPIEYQLDNPSKFILSSVDFIIFFMIFNY